MYYPKSNVGVKIKSINPHETLKYSIITVTICNSWAGWPPEPLRESSPPHNEYQYAVICYVDVSIARCANVHRSC